MFKTIYRPVTLSPHFDSSPSDSNHLIRFFFDCFVFYGKTENYKTESCIFFNITKVSRVMSDSETHEVEDPVELMLKRTGCIELHYKVQVSLYIMCVD